MMAFNLKEARVPSKLELRNVERNTKAILSPMYQKPQKRLAPNKNSVSTSVPRTHAVQFSKNEPIIIREDVTYQVSSAQATQQPQSSESSSI